jgi:hypothetical protein
MLMHIFNEYVKIKLKKKLHIFNEYVKKNKNIFFRWK